MGLANAQANTCTNGFARDEALLHAGRDLGDGKAQYVFASPQIEDGTAISKIERTLRDQPGVENVRVNLTLKRVTVTLDHNHANPADISSQLEQLGYPAQPVDLGDLDELSQKRGDIELLKSLAVSGFASANIMLLSVSVWSGADGSTRELFHLISAAIALPAVFYGGRSFFSSAAQALGKGKVNMDVPISLAITLATAMSLFEAFTGGDRVYFEASTMLLFFLLIGRYLDQRMRARVRDAAAQLGKLATKGANLLQDDGSTLYTPVDEVMPGQNVRVFAGDRIPLDGIVANGISDVDRALVTGESAPESVTVGAQLEAGALNLTGVLDLKIIRAADQSFLAEIRSMMEAAQKGRSAYVQIADRMARLYAPFVHLAAATAFIVWMIATGGDWHTSLYIAIALLIITCPCALGLAVPVVQVIAAGRLFESGILAKDGSALERLAEIDHATFDKTGTLTTGMPMVDHCTIKAPSEMAACVALAHASSHPASRALANYFVGQSPASLSDVTEIPGQGVQGRLGGKRVRLGSAVWTGEIATGDTQSYRGLGFAIEGKPLRTVKLRETLRKGATESIANLRHLGIDSEIISGDTPWAVAKIADKLPVSGFHGAMTPKDKVTHIEAKSREGRKVLVVGDGINDGPALAAGHVSMAPSSASDIGRIAADFVFTRESLEAINTAHDISLRAKVLIKQNFALAAGYNLIAIPIAFAGYVTPLVAAIAMSASSIVVVANSMRLTRDRKKALPIHTKTPSASAQILEPAQ